MIPKRLLIVLVILVLLPLAGCTATQTPEVPNLAEMQVAVQQTLDYENAIKAQLTQAAQTDQPQPPAQQPTQETPQSTAYVPPSVPMLSVSMNSNCREGPDSKIWKSIGSVMVGEKAEIVAVYNKGGWYVVKNPTWPTERCWVWGFYATIEGDTSLLPLATKPPLPTPKP